MVSSIDGFKDYDEVNVKVKTGTISSIYPSPTTGTATITYSLENVSSAYLMLIPPSGTSISNYLLSSNGGSLSLDLGTMQTGVYTLALICDGQVVDAKTIQKQ